MEEDPLGLLAGETSMLPLSAFYLVVDVWKLRRWSFFFRVIGLNSITIYLAVKMSHFQLHVPVSFFRNIRLVRFIRPRRSCCQNARIGMRVSLGAAQK